MKKQHIQTQRQMELMPTHKVCELLSEALVVEYRNGQTKEKTLAHAKSFLNSLAIIDATKIRDAVLGSVDKVVTNHQCFPELKNELFWRTKLSLRTHSGLHKEIRRLSKKIPQFSTRQEWMSAMSDLCSPLIDAKLVAKQQKLAKPSKRKRKRHNPVYTMGCETTPLKSQRHDHKYTMGCETIRRAESAIVNTHTPAN